MPARRKNTTVDRKIAQMERLMRKASAMGLDAEEDGDPFADANSAIKKEALRKVFAPANQETIEDQILEGEAVLLYYSLNGQGFHRQKCPECDRIFAYKYTIPKEGIRCSNECRKASLAKIGIDWNYDKKPEHRWTMVNQGQRVGTLPLIVSPSALEILDVKIADAGNSA